MGDINSSLPVTDSSEGTPGTAVPALATQVAGTDGTNLRTVKTDASGRQLVDLFDGVGNSLTSQANNAQRALDVGINVTGVQIDPRQVGLVQTSIPSVANTTQSSPALMSNLASVQADMAYAFTQWGKMWAATTGIFTPITTVETPVFLFKNPNASGKIVKIQKMYMSAVGGANITEFNIYLNPTILTNGTAITAVGRRQTGQSTLSTTLSKIPTVSANGTLVEVHRITAGTAEEVVDFDFSLWLEGNNNFLITVTESTAAATTLSFIFAEE